MNETDRRRPPRPSTVLVLDDDDAVLASVRRILLTAGYETLTASSAHEALRVLDEHPGPVDLLLCDLVLPDLGGREAANTLVARRPGMAVLFTSGFSSPDSFRRELESEGVAFLGKPFEVRELLAAVEGMLPKA